MTLRLSPSGILACVLMLGATFAAGALTGSYYYHRIETKLASDAPPIPNDLVAGLEGTSCQPPSCPEDSLLQFRVVPAFSEAAFFADVKLGGIALPTRIKGSTSRLSGEFRLRRDAPWMSLASSTFVVDLRSLASEVPSRLVNIGRLLDTDQFPQATFTIDDLDGVSPTRSAGEEQSLKLTGTLTLHGTRRDVAWDVKARWQGPVVAALATTSLRFEDFGIRVPHVTNAVTSGDAITVQVKLVAVQESGPRA